MLEVAEAVAASLDVEHVTMMQQPIEDGGGEDLVAGQELRPVLDAFVGGDEDRAAAVAIGDEAEEETRLGAGHGLEAHLVDDQKGDVEVLAPAQPGGREVGVGPQRGEQLLEAQEQHREAVLDGFHPQGDAEVCFPDARRTLDEQRLLGAQPRAGGQGFDLGALDRGLEGEVEAAEGLPGG